MNCEVRTYQIIGTFYNSSEGTRTFNHGKLIESEGFIEEELSNVRCFNPAAVKLGSVWVCWEHLASEYGFETSAVLE